MCNLWRLHAYTSMGSFRIVKQDSVAVKYLNIYGIKIWGKQKDLTLYSEKGVSVLSTDSQNSGHKPVCLLLHFCYTDYQYKR